MKLQIYALLLWLLGIVGNAGVVNYHFSTTSSSVNENIATHKICFTVKLTPAPVGQDAPSVAYSMSNGTAEGASSFVDDGHHDYKTSSGTVSFASGYTPYGNGQNTYATKDVCTDVYDDTVYEGLSEYFYFNLSNALPNTNDDTADIVAGSTRVEGQIVENDTTNLPTVEISDQNGAENGGQFIFTVTLSRAVGTDVTMNFTTQSNTARDNTSPVGLQDYNATSGTLTFPVGTTTQTISVPIINDNIVETLNERFSVELSNLSSNVSPYDLSGEGTITDDDGVTSQYCSPYRGMISLNEYHHMVTYKDIGTDHPVQLGNFIELKRDPLHVNPDFQPDNNWSIVVYTGAGGNAKTFSFAERDTSCGYNTPYLVFNYGNYNLPGTAVDVAVFDGAGKEVDFFSFNNPHYRESNCIAHPDATGAAFPFDTNITLGNAADKDIFRDPDGTGDWTSSGSGANSGATRCWEPASLTFGYLDAVDEDVTPTFNPYNGILRTKVSNRNGPLKVVSLNSTKTGYRVLNHVVIKAFRIDSDGSVSEEIGDVELDGVSTAPIETFSRAFAKKDSRILFQYCDVNNTVTGDYHDCIANNGTLKSSASFDNFAIRPKAFYNNLTPGFTMKAGVNQSGITFQAQDEVGDPTLQYNESETTASASFVVDVNISDSTKVCAQPSIHFTPRVTFIDGEVTGTYTLDNVADFNVTMHENIGLEFAYVDFDDTNDSQRLIASSSVKQIKVIPDHFTIDGNLTNGSNGFTYLSNFDGNGSKDQGISALLDTNITAKAFNNTTITTNYTGSCYAKDGDVSLGITLPAITPVGNLTKMVWYDDINKSVDGNFTLGSPYTPVPYSALRFMSGDSNGTANVRYGLNFDRNQTKLVDPFTMTVNEVNATDSDVVQGTKTLTGNNSAYYVYGRIIPQNIRIFGANKSFTANGWYEVYNTSSIGAISLPSSKNDNSWFTNTLHSDVPTVYDGDANVTVVITGNNPVNTNITTGTGLETYTFDDTYALGGYKAHIKTDSWLWYGATALPYLDPVNFSNLDCLTHPCFNINVVPPVGATGSAKSTNEATKASKASGSGGGAWKSTTDYAPAIR